jgi:hypothetical protein
MDSELLRVTKALLHNWYQRGFVDAWHAERK